MRTTCWLTSVAIGAFFLSTAAAAETEETETLDEAAAPAAPGAETSAAAQAIAAPGPVGAVANPALRTITYELAFFASFAPRTALDIAQRVPGFSLDLGSNQNGADVRGFAGVAGNVVINGARPSSKAESLETLLARIPAQRVTRVEVGPGDLFGSDYAGKSQVLNVIMSAQTGLDANFTAQALRRYNGFIDRNFSASAVFQRGPSTFNVSAGTGRNRQEEEGTDDQSVTSTGTTREYRRKFNTYLNRDPYISGSWALERSPSEAMRLNGRWQRSRFDLDQESRVREADGTEHDDDLYQHYRNPVIEIGGDITRPFVGGAIKLVGLATRRKRDNLDEYVERDGLIEDEDAQIVGGFEQTVNAKRNETIGRLSWARGDLAGFSFEAGVEGAYNTLDNATELYVIGSGGSRTRIDLPIDQATVQEKRGEAFMSLGRNLTPTLRIDGGVNYEMSRLKVRGDAVTDRSLRFFKPNLAIDWRPAEGWHARLSARRTVAQLNFYDFVSVAELSNDRVNGGNAELLPQRTWELRATFDKSILGDGLLKLDLGLDRVSLLQDQILTEEGFSAPGNIGTGRRSFARLSIDAPLSRLGLEGVTLKAFGEVQRTRVHDPISGTTRNFSDFFPDWQWNVELRRDAGSLSYGLTVSDRAPFSFFRANEIDTNWNGGPFGTAFVEFRVSPRSSIRLDVENLFNTHSYRERLFFSPNRSTADPYEREFRERNRHLTFGISAKQSFGGSGGGARVAQAD